MRPIKSVEIKVFPSDRRSSQTFKYRAKPGQFYTDDAVMRQLAEFKETFDETFPGNTMVFVKLDRNKFNLVHAVANA